MIKMSDFKHGLFRYEVKDYYSILGVPIDASARDIRLRYLKIAYQLHPDTCHLDTPEGKENASQILSKLVNPAYENLFKDNLRKECQLILSEVGRRLATDEYQVDIVTDTGKKLYAKEDNYDSFYKEMISKLATDLYGDIDKVKTKIALISELNLVYLIRSKQDESKPKRAKIATSTLHDTPSSVTESSAKKTEVPTENNQPQSTTVNNETSKKVEDKSNSRVQKILTNAQRHQEMGNPEQGIIELREALKLESDNPTIHGLLACLYLQQGNLPMARIHSKKGIALNGEDTYVKQSQTELQEIEKKEKQTANQGKPPAKGKKGKSTKAKGKSTAKSKDKDKDGKGKKEPPKIFGIPLW